MCLRTDRWMDGQMDSMLIATRVSPKPTSRRIMKFNKRPDGIAI